MHGKRGGIVVFLCFLSDELAVLIRPGFQAQRPGVWWAAALSPSHWPPRASEIARGLQVRGKARFPVQSFEGERRVCTSTFCANISISALVECRPARRDIYGC